MGNQTSRPVKRPLLVSMDQLTEAVIPVHSVKSHGKVSIYVADDKKPGGVRVASVKIANLPKWADKAVEPPVGGKYTPIGTIDTDTYKGPDDLKPYTHEPKEGVAYESSGEPDPDKFVPVLDWDDKHVWVFMKVLGKVMAVAMNHNQIAKYATSIGFPETPMKLVGQIDPTKYKGPGDIYPFDWEPGDALPKKPPTAKDAEEVKFQPTATPEEFADAMKLATLVGSLPVEPGEFETAGTDPHGYPQLKSKGTGQLYSILPGHKLAEYHSDTQAYFLVAKGQYGWSPDFDIPPLFPDEIEDAPEEPVHPKMPLTKGIPEDQLPPDLDLPPGYVATAVTDAHVMAITPDGEQVKWVSKLGSWWSADEPWKEHRPGETPPPEAEPVAEPEPVAAEPEPAPEAPEPEPAPDTPPTTTAVPDTDPLLVGYVNATATLQSTPPAVLPHGFSKAVGVDDSGAWIIQPAEPTSAGFVYWALLPNGEVASFIDMGGKQDYAVYHHTDHGWALPPKAVMYSADFVKYFMKFYPKGKPTPPAGYMARFFDEYGLPTVAKEPVTNPDSKELFTKVVFPDKTLAELMPVIAGKVTYRRDDDVYVTLEEMREGNFGKVPEVAKPAGPVIADEAEPPPKSLTYADSTDPNGFPIVDETLIDSDGDDIGTKGLSLLPGDRVALWDAAAGNYAIHEYDPDDGYLDLDDKLSQEEAQALLSDAGLVVQDGKYYETEELPEEVPDPQLPTGFTAVAPTPGEQGLVPVMWDLYNKRGYLLPGGMVAMPKEDEDRYEVLVIDKEGGYKKLVKFDFATIDEVKQLTKGLAIRINPARTKLTGKKDKYGFPQVKTQPTGFDAESEILSLLPNGKVAELETEGDKDRYLVYYWDDEEGEFFSTEPEKYYTPKQAAQIKPKKLAGKPPPVKPIMDPVSDQLPPDETDPHVIELGTTDKFGRDQVQLKGKGTYQGTVVSKIPVAGAYGLLHIKGYRIMRWSEADGQFKVEKDHWWFPDDPDVYHGQVSNVTGGKLAPIGVEPESKKLEPTGDEDVNGYKLYTSSGLPNGVHSVAKLPQNKLGFWYSGGGNYSLVEWDADAGFYVINGKTWAPMGAVQSEAMHFHDDVALAGLADYKGTKVVVLPNGAYAAFDSDKDGWVVHTVNVGKGNVFEPTELVYSSADVTRMTGSPFNKVLEPTGTVDNHGLPMYRAAGGFEDSISYSISMNKTVVLLPSGQVAAPSVLDGVPAYRVIDLWDEDKPEKIRTLEQLASALADAHDVTWAPSKIKIKVSALGAAFADKAKQVAEKIAAQKSEAAGAPELPGLSPTGKKDENGCPLYGLTMDGGVEAMASLLPTGEIAKYQLPSTGKYTVLTYNEEQGWWVPTQSVYPWITVISLEDAKKKPEVGKLSGAIKAAVDMVSMTGAPPFTVAAGHDFNGMPVFTPKDKTLTRISVLPNGQMAFWNKLIKKYTVVTFNAEEEIWEYVKPKKRYTTDDVVEMSKGKKVEPAPPAHPGLTPQGTKDKNGYDQYKVVDGGPWDGKIVSSLPSGDFAQFVPPGHSYDLAHIDPDSGHWEVIYPPQVVTAGALVQIKKAKEAPVPGELSGAIAMSMAWYAKNGLPPMTKDNGYDINGFPRVRGPNKSGMDQRLSILPDGSLAVWDGLKSHYQPWQFNAFGTPEYYVKKPKSVQPLKLADVRAMSKTAEVEVLTPAAETVDKVGTLANIHASAKGFGATTTDVNGLPAKVYDEGSGELVSQLPDGSMGWWIEDEKHYVVVKQVADDEWQFVSPHKIVKGSELVNMTISHTPEMKAAVDAAKGVAADIGEHPDLLHYGPDVNGLPTVVSLVDKLQVSVLPNGAYAFWNTDHGLYVKADFEGGEFTPLVPTVKYSLDDLKMMGQDKEVAKAGPKPKAIVGASYDGTDPNGLPWYSIDGDPTVHISVLPNGEYAGWGSASKKYRKMVWDPDGYWKLAEDGTVFTLDDVQQLNMSFKNLKPIGQDSNGFPAFHPKENHAGYVLSQIGTMEYEYGVQDDEDPTLYYAAYPSLTWGSGWNYDADIVLKPALPKAPPAQQVVSPPKNTTAAGDDANGFPHFLIQGSTPPKHITVLPDGTTAVWYASAKKYRPHVFNDKFNDWTPDSSKPMYTAQGMAEGGKKAKEPKPKLEPKPPEGASPMTLTNTGKKDSNGNPVFKDKDGQEMSLLPDGSVGTQHQFGGYEKLGWDNEKQKYVDWDEYIEVDELADMQKTVDQDAAFHDPVAAVQGALTSAPASKPTAPPHLTPTVQVDENGYPVYHDSDGDPMSLLPDGRVAHYVASTATYMIHKWQDEYKVYVYAGQEVSADDVPPPTPAPAPAAFDPLAALTGQIPESAIVKFPMLKDATVTGTTDPNGLPIVEYPSGHGFTLLPNGHLGKWHEDADAYQDMMISGYGTVTAGTVFFPLDIVIDMVDEVGVSKPSAASGTPPHAKATITDPMLAAALEDTGETDPYGFPVYKAVKGEQSIGMEFSLLPDGRVAQYSDSPPSYKIVQWNDFEEDLEPTLIVLPVDAVLAMKPAPAEQPDAPKYTQPDGKDKNGYPKYQIIQGEMTGLSITMLPNNEVALWDDTNESYRKWAWKSDEDGWVPVLPAVFYDLADVKAMEAPAAPAAPKKGTYPTAPPMIPHLTSTGDKDGNGLWVYEETDYPDDKVMLLPDGGLGSPVIAGYIRVKWDEDDEVFAIVSMDKVTHKEVQDALAAAPDAAAPLGLPDEAPKGLTFTGTHDHNGLPIYKDLNGYEFSVLPTSGVVLYYNAAAGEYTAMNYKADVNVYTPTAAKLTDAQVVDSVSDAPPAPGSPEPSAAAPPAAEPQAAASTVNVAPSKGDTDAVFLPPSSNLVKNLADTLPDPSTLKPLGDAKSFGLGGMGKKEIYQDPITGKKYIFKPAVIKGTSTAEPMRIAAQEANAALAMVLRDDHIPVKGVKINGVAGTLQPWIDLDTQGVMTGSEFHSAPEKLNEKQREQVAVDHILDWVTSQNDTHGDNFVFAANGNLYSIDKEQGWKFHHKDKLSLTNNPQGNADPPYYNTFWRAFEKGKMDDFDPKVLGSAFAKLEAVDSADYLAMIRPYAEERWKGQPAEQQKFLKQMLLRKLHARRDFEEFITKLYKKRTKKDGVFTFDAGWIVDDPSVGPQTVTKTYSGSELISYLNSKHNIEKKGYKDPATGQLDPSAGLVTLKVSSSFGVESLEAVLNDLGITPQPVFAGGATSITGSYNHIMAVKESDLMGASLTVEELIQPLGAGGFPPTPNLVKNFGEVEEPPIANPNLQVLNKAAEDIETTQLGQRVTFDGNDVEGMTGKIRRYKDSQGFFLFKTFKLRQRMWNKVGKELEDQPVGERQWVGESYTFRKGTYNADEDVTVLTSSPVYHDAVSFRAFKFTFPEGELYIARPTHHFEPYSYIAMVVAHIRDVKANALSTLKSMLNKALPNLKKGIGLGDAIMKAPTKAQQHKRKLYRAAWAFGGKKGRLAETLSLPKLTEKVQELAGKHGYDLNDVLERMEEREVLPGYNTHVLPGRWKQLGSGNAWFVIQAFKLGSLVPVITSGALIGISMRNQLGVSGFSNGGSFERDSNNGAGDQGQCRLVTAAFAHESPGSFAHGYGDYVAVVHPRVLDRMDSYLHFGDKYGCCSPYGFKSAAWNSLQPLEESMQTLSDSSAFHEIDFRQGIRLSQVLRIVTTGNTSRTTGLEECKNKGITEVNGVPIEEFIVYESSAQAIWDKYVKPVAEI